MRVFSVNSRKTSNRAYKTTEKEKYEKACKKHFYGCGRTEQYEKALQLFNEKKRDEWFKKNL